MFLWSAAHTLPLCVPGSAHLHEPLGIRAQYLLKRLHVGLRGVEPVAVFCALDDHRHAVMACGGCILHDMKIPSSALGKILAGFLGVVCLYFLAQAVARASGEGARHNRHDDRHGY